MQDPNNMSWRRSTTSGYAPTTNMRNAISWALTNRIEPTDVNIAAEATSELSTTDVVYFEANYTGPYCGSSWWTSAAGGKIGYTSCILAVGLKCERFNIYLSRQWETSPTRTAAERQNLATHETGHSVGLTHPVAGVPSCTVMGDCGSSFDHVHEIVNLINPNY